ncbi:MAG: hypothetical protein WD904_05150 [Dehalococcoidia bacterium]
MSGAVRSAALALAASALLIATACGDDDGGNTQTPSSKQASGSPGVPPTPAPTLDGLIPPLEGPPRDLAPVERTDFRELPEWQLPRPQGMPTPPADALRPEYAPPVEPECPDDWAKISRPTESFELCYPAPWVVGGHGYVSAGNEERWYSVGIVLFDGAAQTAHVSVYAFPRFSRPVRYTIDCPQAYALTVAGHDAVLCPDYPPTPPETRLISYNILFQDIDYFVNVVSYEGAPDETLATAIAIAQTFRFLED